MTFPRVKPGSWAFGEILTSAQMNTLDVDHSNALDGAAGGAYAPAAVISIAGKGLWVGGTVAQNAQLSTANAKWAGPTLDLSSGPSVALNMNNVCGYAEGMFIATCSNAADKIVSSKDDGFSWLDKSASISPAQTIILTSCAAGAGIIILGGNSAKIYVGVDDTSFLNQTIPGSPTRLDALCFDTTHSLFIIAGQTAGAPFIASMTTSLVATARTVPGGITGSNNAISVAQSTGGIIVASWDNQTKLAFSTDGTTWTASTTSLTSAGYRVAFGDGVFLAHARASANIYKSSDGNTWSASGLSAVSTTVSSLTCFNGIFAATSGNKLWLSADRGATWASTNVQYLGYSTLSRARAEQGRLHVFCTDLTNSVDMRSRRLGFSDGSI